MFGYFRNYWSNAHHVFCKDSPTKGLYEHCQPNDLDLHSSHKCISNLTTFNLQYLAQYLSHFYLAWPFCLYYILINGAGNLSCFAWAKQAVTVHHYTPWKGVRKKGFRANTKCSINCFECSGHWQHVLMVRALLTLPWSWVSLELTQNTVEGWGFSANWYREKQTACALIHWVMSSSTLYSWVTAEIRSSCTHTITKLTAVKLNTYAHLW